MANILFVGENPYSVTGNGNMLRALVRALDKQKHTPACFAAMEHDYSRVDPFVSRPVTIIPAMFQEDEWGNQHLLNILDSIPLDILFMVGIDIWRYSLIFPYIKRIQQKRGFKWIALFPYDLKHIRKDYVNWIKHVDFPLVYSKYGEDVLSPYVPRTVYFRPPLPEGELFVPYSEKEATKARRQKFPTISDSTFLFGFVGVNQMRKDPQTLMQAFKIVTETTDVPCALYMHTNMNRGVFNLYQYAADISLPKGSLLTRGDNGYTRKDLADIYNGIDCLVNCSWQEGLSWTVVESLACGTPVIASDSTAHKELLERQGILVPCTVPRHLPLITAGGASSVDTSGCSAENIAQAMLHAVDQWKTPQFGKWKTLSNIVGNEWKDGVHDINRLLDLVVSQNRIEVKETEKEDAVLFMQHSAAGDVLMTTQCLAGIKERHPNKPLVYMTQPQFQDIVRGNPHIDKIIDYDENQKRKYSIVYNPHGDRILPGGFNSLDTRLADMYPYFCKVSPNPMYIELVKPDIELPEEYVVVHTTGGSPRYRGYTHMDIVATGLGIPVVQIGGEGDIACNKVQLDLRGKLSFRETAYVMKNAKAAVVIDSFPSHLAGAVGTPAVVLFGPAPARVVGPIGHENMIFLEPNKLDVCRALTNCWGSDIECKSPCINTISPLKVKKALKEFLS